MSDLAERDIGLARDYVVSSWLAVKFQEVIPLLSWEINVTENQLRRMSLLELSEYQKLVEEMLNNVDDYVNRIEEELSYI